MIGENFHGVSSGNKAYTVKVFPYGDNEARNIDDCDRCVITAQQEGDSVKGHVGKRCLIHLVYCFTLSLYIVHLLSCRSMPTNATEVLFVPANLFFSILYIRSI